MAASEAVASTGIPGLDDIVRGGYPRGRLMLIEGDPGVGKTTLALQFLIQGRREGERCLYVTLSETRDELNAVADSHGLSLEGIDLYELTPPDALTGGDENTLFHPAEVELAETTRAVVTLCARLQPQRVVFDSLSEIRLLAQSHLRYRREVLSLKQYFSTRNCTVLMLDDNSATASDGDLQSIAHGVVSLDQRAPLYGAQRRRLRVIKLRGVDFRGGYHDYNIRRGGLEVFPRLVASEHLGAVVGGPVSSGLPQLDTLLGGGLDRGTSALFLGPAGTGKSSLATQFAVAAAARQERVAIYAFDESLATMLARSASIGLDLTGPRSQGLINIRQVDPAEVPPGQFSWQVRSEVEEGGAGLVIIDSLNGYLNAMPEESFLTLQLHELLTYLGQRGVLTIMLMAQHGLLGPEVISPVDVSYLADSVIMLRHFEAAGTLRKALSVLKKRTGRHEQSVRELRLHDRGLEVGRPLVDFEHVLTGNPRYLGKPESLLGDKDVR